jgi:hypothetical protein
MSLDPARLQQHLDGLCAELREHASLLVEAFGVPERMLGDAGRLPAGDDARPAVAA